MRKSISEKVVADLLIKTRRRCCLCYYLEGDADRKKVQIAHIDQDKGNNSPENLVPLCLDHHDEYDSMTSQSKGISKHELLSYKERLIEEIENGTISTTDSFSNVSQNSEINAPDFRDGIFYSYGVLFSEVSRIIFKHDPMNINFGNNPDEYNPEAHDIIAHLQRTDSKRESTKICEDVFIKWFDKYLAKKFKNYKSLANDIWRAWEHFKRIRQLYVDDDDNNQ